MYLVCSIGRQCCFKFDLCDLIRAAQSDQVETSAVKWVSSQQSPFQEVSVWIATYLVCKKNIVHLTFSSLCVSSDYRGCFPLTSRNTLIVADYNDMTVTLCRELCRGENHTHAALSRGVDCYCLDNEPSSSDQLAYTDCAYKCAGNANQHCGGEAGAVAVYFVGTCIMNGAQLYTCSLVSAQLYTCSLVSAHLYRIERMLAIDQKFMHFVCIRMQHTLAMGNVTWSNYHNNNLRYPSLLDAWWGEVVPAVWLDIPKSYFEG